MNTANSALQVKCPTCEKKFEYRSSKYRPFCCERCKMVDLGHWLEESYTVKSDEDLDEENEQE